MVLFGTVFTCLCTLSHWCHVIAVACVCLAEHEHSASQDEFPFVYKCLHWGSLAFALEVACMGLLLSNNNQCASVCAAHKRLCCVCRWWSEEIPPKLGLDM